MVTKNSDKNIKGYIDRQNQPKIYNHLRVTCNKLQMIFFNHVGLNKDEIMVMGHEFRFALCREYLFVCLFDYV